MIRTNYPTCVRCGLSLRYTCVVVKKNNGNKCITDEKYCKCGRRHETWRRCETEQEAHLQTLRLAGCQLVGLGTSQLCVLQAEQGEEVPPPELQRLLSAYLGAVKAPQRFVDSIVSDSFSFSAAWDPIQKHELWDNEPFKCLEFYVVYVSDPTSFGMPLDGVCCKAVYASFVSLLIVHVHSGI